ncbi:biotin-independent malonate decarboxylase subunit gamma [Achromobacter kerstersii]|uniref:biotin-independent malonate decarboxylase subunit gamma n=1 Tax=Achromobacter kerstersii TaxID=1353890 RepID=UPI003D02E682
MTLDDILGSLFADSQGLVRENGLLWGRARLADDGQDRMTTVIGVEGRAFVGVDDAIVLARVVLQTIAQGAAQGSPEPILVLIDSSSQRMSKRDELLGLNEFLAHLAKSLIYAHARGHATVGLLYGHTAAGAFIATALATSTLLALPGAHPAVMDLPSMARVTKLPLTVLEEKAKSTPVFAPGLDNLAQTGGVAQVLNPDQPLSAQLRDVLATLNTGLTPGLTPHERAQDHRDRLGKTRGGRPVAADIADQVYALARAAI